MKTKIIIFLIIPFLVFTSQPVLAKSTATPSAVRSQFQQTVKTIWSEAKQKQIDFVSNTIKNSLTNRHNSLIKIKDKLQTRLDQNPMKKDTTLAQTELAKFPAVESQYQTDLASLDAKFTELKSATKPLDIIKDLKNATQLVRNDLNLMKKILNTSILDLAQAPRLYVIPTN